MFNRNFVLLLITIIFLFSKASCQCQPFFPRMFYNPDSSQILPNQIDLIFIFNTNISCPSSYIQVFYHNKVAKSYCQQNKVQTLFSNKSVQFVQYIQKCSVYLTQDTDIIEFSYKPYGCRSFQQCEPYSTDSLVVELPTFNYPLKLVVLADWGPLTHEKYEPLNKTLIYALEQRREEKQKSSKAQWRISGMIMQGDYAYNFETNNCQNYLLFMKELERISKYWPMIPNSGNHETGHTKSMYLFQNSFVIGNLSTIKGSFKRAQNYRFSGRFTLVHYDPFLQIYGKSTPPQYTSMKSTIEQYLVSARKSSPDQFVLMGSHYPIRCAQIDEEHCYATLKALPELFNYLSTPYMGKGLVDLYLGAHMHQYERLLPYSQGKFVKEQSPFTRGRLVSIVEGVAGNAEYLVDELVPADFTANYRVGQTGFGILTIFGNSLINKDDLTLKYQHVSTYNTFTVTDEFVIVNKFLPTGNLVVQNY